MEAQAKKCEAQFGISIWLGGGGGLGSFGKILSMQEVLMFSGTTQELIYHFFFLRFSKDSFFIDKLKLFRGVGMDPLHVFCNGEGTTASSPIKCEVSWSINEENTILLCLSNNNMQRLNFKTQQFTCFAAVNHIK